MKTIHFFIPAVLSICFCACSTKQDNPVPPDPPPAVDTSTQKVVSWITTADQTQLLKRQAAVPFTTPQNRASVLVDTTQKFQNVDGFGYTLTGGSAYVINRMPATAKANLLQELFGTAESGVHISFLRVSIGASDLNASVFTYDDMPAGQTDAGMAHFTLAPDEADLIPLLKEIVAINPQIKILGSPWTPPVWMKDNGSSIGGSLKPENYPAYAKYFVKYVQEMKNAGITVWGITPQNEPLNPANNPSLQMLAAQQADFIKNHLGPAFQTASISTKIIVYDHNCDRPDYPLDVLNDAAAKAFVDGSAFHLYAGDIGALLQVHNQHPDKNVYFTEQYTAIESDFGGDLRWHVKNLVIGAPRNWSKTVLEWNLANDPDYGPHTPGGCTTCKGGLTIDGSNVKRNVAYYIIAHASAFVPPGSVRVASNIPGNIQNVAYVTPQGKVVVIALNDGDAPVTFNVQLGDKAGTISLPTGAVATVLF